MTGTPSGHESPGRDGARESPGRGGARESPGRDRAKGEAAGRSDPPGVLGGDVGANGFDRADETDRADGAYGVVGAGKGRARRLLWSRDFGLFFTARAVAALGDTMLPVALAAGLLQHGYGAGAVGLAMAASGACFAGLVIFGGVFADRFSTRLLMMGADVVRLLTQSLAAAFFFSGRVVLWEICAIGAVNGAAAAVFQPGVASTVPRLASDVQAANGAIRVAESTAQLAGPAIAGLLVAFTSPGGVFAAHAGTYAVSALCLLLLRLPPVALDDRGGRTGFRAELAEGWREFRARAWLWGVIAFWCLRMIVVVGPTVVLVATVVVKEHGPQAYGLVNSALGAGTVVGGLIALRLRPHRMLRAGSLALFSFAVFPGSVGAGLDVPLMAAGAAVAGAGQSFWGVMWATSVQTQVPPDVLNRIHAYDVAGSLAMLPVGQALAGPAAEVFGAEHVLLSAGATSLVVTAAMLAVPAIRGLLRVDAPSLPALESDGAIRGSGRVAREPGGVAPGPDSDARESGGVTREPGCRQSR